MHEKTIEMYNKAGMEYHPTTEDYVRMGFDRATKDKPRKYRIDQMYRVRHIDRDYIVYNQTILSSDFPGNEITCTETVGYHDEPIFQKRFDEASGQPKPVAVQGNERKYDIPATRENIMKILAGPNVVPTKTNF